MARVENRPTAELMFGAFLMRELLRDVEDQGYYLPQITEDTVNTAVVEAKMPQTTGEALSADSIVKDYFRENGDVVDFLADLPYGLYHGAETYYTFKRNQFFADQLSRRFDPSS